MVEKICNEIIETCTNKQKDYKGNKGKLESSLYELEDILRAKIINEEELQRILNAHNEICKLSNRKAGLVEEHLLRMIIGRSVSQFIMRDKIPEGIELLQEDFDEKNKVTSTQRKNSKILHFCFEILRNNKYKKSREKKRLKEALRILDKLNMYYHIPSSKKYLYEKIEHEDEDLQELGMSGLEMYYEGEKSEKIEERELQKIETVISNSKNRDLVSSGYQILISTGVIDEFEAVMRMDDWDEINEY